MTNNEHGTEFCPFVTGGEVTGEQFIGRSEYIKRCMRKLRGGNSVALRGIPRIGKTSLAKKLLDEALKWGSRDIIPIHIVLGTCLSFFHFWREIGKKIETELNTMDRELRCLLDDVKNADDRYEDIKNTVEKLFTYLCSQGKQVILCVDEFDSVVTVFKDGNNDPRCYFLFLRELMSNTKEYGVSFIIVSRRGLASLESRTEGGSTFDGVIEPTPIRGFSDKELIEFREYATKHDLILSNDDWGIIINQAGRSPYMLSRAAVALLDAEEGKNIKEVLREYEPTHFSYFDRMLELMREDNCKDLKRMVKIFIGPQYDLTGNDINELKHGGYIWQEKYDAPYETLSVRFEQYLREETRRDLNLEIWPLLTETENRLRDVIETKMRTKYNDKWEDELIMKARNKGARKEYFIDSAKVDRHLSKKLHTNQRLIDTISFLEYMNIIQEYRNDLFNDIFVGWARTEIERLFKTIHQTRNPYAHSNGHLLNDLEIQEADLACKKILDGINSVTLMK